MRSHNTKRSTQTWKKLSYPVVLVAALRHQPSHQIVELSPLLLLLRVLGVRNPVCGHTKQGAKAGQWRSWRDGSFWERYGLFCKKP